MQAGTTFPKGIHPAFWAAAVLGIGLLGLVSLSLAEVLPLPAPAGAGVDGPRLAYFEFGRTADTLWLTDPQQPARREKLFAAPHAREYGVVPSLVAEGGRFAYAALPPATRAPTADTPADLWLAELKAGAQPRRLAQGIDLLVRPVWSPDGKQIVFRRSGGAYALFAVDAASGAERLLVAAAEALFPVGFAPDGRLYYVQLSSAGSDLLVVDPASGGQAYVARLGDGLTRDWALSPAGDRLAYLAMSFAPERVSSRAHLLDLTNGRLAPIGTTDANDFSPVWSATGELAVGRLAAGQRGAGVLRLAGEDGSALPGPALGFDVPLAPAPGGGFVVRSFEGASATAPGRSVLAVVGADGRRITIASGEVTFLGWTQR